MKSIDIKGKKYIPVNERLIYFRDQEVYKGWVIRLKVVNRESIADECLVRCRIYDDLGIIRAEEWAFERADGSFINKLSHVENCCTSAMGRCLGQLGIGIDESVASFEEVANNINQQGDKPWLEHTDFNAAIRELNETADDSERQRIYHKLDVTYKMKKDYRRQLQEVVKQRDIEI